MKALLATLLVAIVAVLPAKAETTNICDRTPAVRDAILAKVTSTDCAAVDLASVTGTLYLESELTSLKAGDFDGLGSLESLNLGDNDLATLPAGVFDGLDSLVELDLYWNLLTTLPDGVFDGLDSLEYLNLWDNELTTLPASIFNDLGNLRTLNLSNNQLATLPDGVFDGLASLEILDLRRNRLENLTRDNPLFDGLTASIKLSDQYFDICDRTPEVRDAIMETAHASKCAAVNLPEGMGFGRLGLTSIKADDFAGLDLRTLDLSDNRLTTLPDDVFDGLDLQYLNLSGNDLTTLPEGLFAGLDLQRLNLSGNDLTTLPEGLFAGLDLQRLNLSGNGLTTLPASVFDGLSSLRNLDLSNNQLTTLPDGIFDGLSSLQRLYAGNNDLTTLPKGLFYGLDILEILNLGNNQLTLRAGMFDGLDSLTDLNLENNQLTTLPAGVFDGLARLFKLNLNNNHLVELTRHDVMRLFPTQYEHAEILLHGQTEAEAEEETETELPRLVAAVPLMLSAGHSTRQGFARIVNRSDEAGVVRVVATDDGGYSPEPFEIRLNAKQTLHFNSDDLQDGNANKGIEGVGAPVQGGWRLDIETTLSVRVLAFVRTNDGFLTAMHDVLLKDDDGRLAAMTFNPGSNDERVSKLRLVNTGDSAESVSIAGVDDQGNDYGPVTLTLNANQSRTLSAQELENGAHGLTGTLGDGRGKWQLFVDAGDAVVAMSLLDASSGHLSNISTMGVAP